MRHVILLLLLFLTSCAQLPPGAVPANPDDWRAIDAAQIAFHRARGAFACEELDEHRVTIATMDSVEVQRWCGVPSANSCTMTYQATPFSPSTVLMIIRSDVNERSRASLVIHEAEHQLRWCWVYGGDPSQIVERIHMGNTDTCRNSYPVDHLHCDTDLWITIERQAVRMWEEGR